MSICLVIAVGGLSLIAGLTPSGNAAEATSKPTTTQASPVWHQILCRALMLYYQDKYSDAFALIEKAIREQAPGQEVHRCIALLQKSFAKVHKLDDPVVEWTPSAQDYIGALEGKKGKQDGDVVLLAAIKGLILDKDRARHQIPNELMELAGRKVKNNGTWSDWAQWAVVRHWCESFYVTEKDCGTVIINVGGQDFRAVLTNAPIPTIKARCAVTMLRERPGTYMGRQLRGELLNWRIAQAEKALSELGSNEWMTDSRQRHEIVPFDRGIEQRLIEIKNSFSGIGEAISKDYITLVNAEIQLDNLLWDDGNKRSIVAYIRVLVPVAEPRVVPEDVRQWLKGLPEGY